MKFITFSVLIVSTLVLTVALTPSIISKNSVVEEMGTPAGWSDDVNLSESALQDQECQIEVDGEIVHVVWVHDYGDIAYSHSNDRGRTWTPFESLHHSDFMGLYYPDVSCSDQNIHVVWHDIEGWDGVYYLNSTDGGDNWNSVKRITPLGVDARGPHIFVNNSNIHLIWHDQRDPDGEIYYRRSLDGGITWDNGQGIDDDRRITFSPATVSDVNMDGDGTNISVIWADERDSDWEIYWMISKDNGFSWENGLGSENVGRKISDDTTDSMWNGIAVNGSTIHIIWVDESWPGPEYRLYYRNSTNSGITWNPIQLLTGPVPGINSPDIDVVGDNIFIVWDDERDDGEHDEIYFKNSTDGGITWSDDLRLTYDLTNSSYWPRIAVDNDIKHVVWYNLKPDNDREVMYKRYPDFPDPEYNISLSQGWNLVSIPLEQSDESLDQVLQSIDGKWDCIQTYDPLSPDHWKSNATFKPDQLNELKTLDHKVGFWIHMNESTNLTVRGFEPGSTTIDLYAGWNLVGYPTLCETMDVGDAFWGTGVNRVEVFNSSEPYNIKEVGPEYVMKPGEGYWVRVPVDTSWTVEW